LLDDFLRAYCKPGDKNMERKALAQLNKTVFQLNSDYRIGVAIEVVFRLLFALIPTCLYVQNCAFEIRLASFNPSQNDLYTSVSMWDGSARYWISILSIISKHRTSQVSSTETEILHFTSSAYHANCDSLLMIKLAEKFAWPIVSAWIVQSRETENCRYSGIAIGADCTKWPLFLQVCTPLYGLGPLV
jgi:hypothetical protein